MQVHRMPVGFCGRSNPFLCCVCRVFSKASEGLESDDDRSDTGLMEDHDEDAADDTYHPE